MAHALALRLGSLAVLLACATPLPSQARLWIRAGESVTALSRSGDGSFGAGVISTTQNATDATVVRFDRQGSALWRRTVGGVGYDSASAVASDGAGGTYVCGSTDGNLGGQNAGPPGHQDPWLARFDAAGNQLWIRQWGAAGSLDRALFLAADGAGGVFVAGDVPGPGNRDAWLARFDATGAQLWATQIGSGGSDIAWAVVSDGAGGALVGGFTGGSLGGSLSGIYDLWLAHYDGAGARVWLRQHGTSGIETLTCLSTDGRGGIYAAGAADATSTLGGAGFGGMDCWIGRFDSTGGWLWVKRVGTSAADYVRAAASADSDHVFACGYTEGSLGGTHAGASDAWIMDLSPTGSILWIRQFGTAGADEAQAVVPAAGGGAIASGRTAGSLGGVQGSWLAHYGAPWHTAGPGIPGTLGKPVLSGSGVPERGQTIQLLLEDALPNAPAVHFAGGAAANLPIPGGILVPSPDLIILGTTDSAGSLRLGLTWPQSAPPGTRIWFQGCVLDAGASHGLAASNALQAVQ